MKFARTALSLTLSTALIAVAGCGSSDSSTDSGDNLPPLATLHINELQPSNQDTITDEQGDADDWLELYNSGSEAVDLKDYAFSDGSGLQQTIKGSLVVPAGGYLLLWADGSTSQGANHLGFKLKASGDQVSFKDTYGRTVDSVVFGSATGQNSYARYPDGAGAFSWCAKPTPGVSNGAACSP
jgi:hypothetical protein